MTPATTFAMNQHQPNTFTTFPAPSNAPRRVALFVGVDKYKESCGIVPLKGAVADASAFCEFSRENKLFDSCELLENPTKAELRQKKTDMTQFLRGGDLFFFFFAGHGVIREPNETVLVCADSDAGPDADGLGCALKFFTSGRPQYHRAIVLDACRSSFRTTRALGSTQTMDAAATRDLVLAMKEFAGGDADTSDDAPTLTILHSCDEGMTAAELVVDSQTGQKRGLFSLALLEVLEEARRNCRTVEFDTDLQAAIAAKMQQKAHASGLTGCQQPWFQKSGHTPPLMPMSSWFDPDRYLRWLQTLRDNHALSVYAHVLTAINGGAMPRADAIVATVAHFGDIALSSGGNAPSDTAAASILTALCQVQEPTKPTPPRPAPAPLPGKRPASPAPTDAERQLLAAFAEKAVHPDWATKHPPEVAILRNPSTVGQAIDILDNLVWEAMRSFGRENNVRAESVGTVFRPESLKRLAAPFLSLDSDSADFEREAKLWDAPQPETPLRAALRRAFVAAKLFTR